jgi:hypothetical protein
MAENGASISTIEARVAIPPNTLSRILRKGREAKDGPYKKFYRLFRQWAAEAKYVAEGIMAKKSPEKWLDRSTTAKLIETEEENQIAKQASSALVPGVEAKAVLAALQILRTQKISIDDALDKGTIDISPLPHHLQDNDDED